MNVGGHRCDMVSVWEAGLRRPQTLGSSSGAATQAAVLMQRTGPGAVRLWLCRGSGLRWRAADCRCRRRWRERTHKKLRRAERGLWRRTLGTQNACEVTESSEDPKRANVEGRGMRSRTSERK